MSITKDRQLIRLDYGNGTYILDCATKSLYNARGKSISKGGAAILKTYAAEHPNMTEWEKLVYCAIRSGNNLTAMCPALETLYSLDHTPNNTVQYNADNILDMIRGRYNIAARGYIPYCREHNYRITADTYIYFIVNAKVDNLTGYSAQTISNLKEVINKWLECHGTSVEHTITAISHLENREQQKKLIKIVIHNGSNYYSISDIDNVVNGIRNNETCIVENEYITVNAGTYRKILKEREEALKYKNMSEKLCRISDLEKIENDKYVIVVPKNLDDLVEEGKKQHNCVGSYYNDSINRGENQIYFIRKKDDPTKNYITCQYSVCQMHTIQLKRYANNRVDKDIVIFVSSIVDPMIAKILVENHLEEIQNSINPNYY